jgi:signal transduction histidine kinase
MTDQTGLLSTFNSIFQKANNFAIYQIAVNPNLPLGASVIFVTPSIKTIVGIDDPYEFSEWFATIHPEDKLRALEANQRAIENWEPYNEAVRFFHSEKKEWVWIHTISEPQFDENGDLTHYNGIILDITDQKKIEEKMHQQLVFENLVSEISTHFINLQHDQINQGINQALQSIGEFSEVDRCYVFLFSPDQHMVTNTHVWCAPGIQPRMQFLKSTLLKALEKHKQVLLEGQILALTQPDQEETEGFGPTETILAVPMIFQEKVMGFFGFHTQENLKTFSLGELNLIKLLGEIFANALQNKQAQEALSQAYATLEQRVNNRTRELMTVLNIAQAASGALDLNEVLTRVANGLADAVGVPYCGIYTVDYEKNLLIPASGTENIPEGNFVKKFNSTKLDPKTNPKYQRLLELKIPTVIYKSENDQNPLGFKSILAVPFVTKERVNAIAMISTEEEAYPFTEEQINLAWGIANTVATTIENANLHKTEMERRVEAEIRREIAESLQDLLSYINSKHKLNDILETILSQATKLLHADGGAIYQYDFDKKLSNITSSTGLPDDLAELISFPLDYSKTHQSVLAHQPYFVPNLDAAVKKSFRKYPDLEPELKLWGETVIKYFKSYLAVPLAIKEEVFGFILMYYKTKQNFTDDSVKLAGSFADQAAIALENARLHQLEQKRQHDLEILLEVASVLNSSLTLEEIINNTLPLFYDENVLHHILVLIKEEETEEFILQGVFPQTHIEPSSLMHNADISRQALELQKYVIYEGEQHAELVLPLSLQDYDLGTIIFVAKAGYVFKDKTINLLESIADQLSVSIDHARLHKDAERNAALTERNRLARELHDAVTQTLFSASLIAQVIPNIWEKDVEKGKELLEEVRMLSRGALAEMRTLLLELRPQALREADLESLTVQLAEANTSRLGIPIHVETSGSYRPPENVKLVFYRIAQEAINNIIKHAHASEVNVRLKQAPKQIQLQIQDNGIGFNPDDVPKDHLGLKIMQERMETINGSLDIISKIGCGTQITAAWHI